MNDKKQGMIQIAVNNLVKLIGEEEIKTAINNAVDTKINTLVITEINKALEVGVTGAIEKALKLKLKPILKAIENVDVSSIGKKINKITIDEKIDTLVDEFETDMKDKVKSAIDEAKGFSIDIKSYNKILNDIIGEQVVDIIEDDSDIEIAIKSKVLKVING